MLIVRMHDLHEQGNGSRARRQMTGRQLSVKAIDRELIESGRAMVIVRRRQIERSRERPIGAEAVLAWVARQVTKGAKTPVTAMTEQEL